MEQETLASLLRRLRTSYQTKSGKAGLPREKLAHLAGVATDTIADIESGKSLEPRPTTLKSLGRVLGYDLFSHVYGDGGKSVRPAPLSIESNASRSDVAQLLGEMLLARLEPLAAQTALQIVNSPRASAVRDKTGVTNDMRKEQIDSVLNDAGVSDSDEREFLSLLALHRGYSAKQLKVWLMRAAPTAVAKSAVKRRRRS
jgi:transcriptional regulator with XRE-family HTH domain